MNTHGCYDYQCVLSIVIPYQTRYDIGLKSYIILLISSYILYISIDIFVRPRFYVILYIKNMTLGHKMFRDLRMTQ